MIEPNSIRPVLAAPRDVAVGTHKHQRELINSLHFGLVQLDDFEWNTRVMCGGRERCSLGGMRGKHQQNKTAAEEIERRAAVGERDVRRAPAGPPRRR